MYADNSQESASPGRGVTGKGASEGWRGLILVWVLGTQAHSAVRIH